MAILKLPYDMELLLLSDTLLMWQLNIPMVVIPAKAGIQKNTGCRLKPGMKMVGIFISRYNNKKE